MEEKEIPFCNNKAKTSTMSSSGIRKSWIDFQVKYFSFDYGRKIGIEKKRSTLDNDENMTKIPHFEYNVCVPLTKY